MLDVLGQIQFVFILSAISTVAFYGFERLMPDFGGAPIIGNIAIGASIFLAVMIASKGAWEHLTIAAPFLIAGIVVNTLNERFPRWSQTPEGKLRLEAEQENHERDKLRSLQDKYDA